MKRKILSALLACCTALSLLSAGNNARAAGSLIGEKGYTLSTGETFEFEFTPSETGIYQITVDGKHERYNERIEIRDAEGQYVSGPSYGKESFFGFMEEGKTYTYSHVGLWEDDKYYFVEICYYPALAVSLEHRASYSVSEKDLWVEFVSFSPKESGWYTFKDSGGAIIYGVYSTKGVQEPLIPATITERGQHIYCEKGDTVILELWFVWNTTGAISVEKASFPALEEGGSVELTLEDSDDGMGIDGGGFCYDYVSFTPSKSGTYKFTFTEQSEDVFSWGASFEVCNSTGMSISSESFSWQTHSGEYVLTAGQTYYVGVTATPGGGCTVSAELIKAEEVRCDKHKYTSATGDICTVCGYEFEPELIPCDETLYAAVNQAAVRDKPYAQAGKLAYSLGKGAKVEPTHYFNNALGRKWYLLEDGNYIYSERLTTKAPKYYTLSFEANGGGVSNLPADMDVIEGTRVAVPGAVSGKPKRKGYNFLGYSTNKNAETAEYLPGKGITMTKDITLYAVWVEKTITYSDDIEDLVFSIINGVNADSKLGDTGQKYWSWYYRKPSSRSDAWCAVYTSWLLEQVGQSSIRTASPNEQVRKLTEAGCYHTKNYTPQTGDLVFFSKYGNNADHVGMIVIQEGSIYILHGNHSRKVCKSAMTDVWTNEPRRLFGDYIMGYGDMESYAEVTAN